MLSTKVDRGLEEVDGRVVAPTPIQPRALDADDIVQAIFSHLSPFYNGRTLANLALVCKDFCDLALDVLWRELGSIVPLLKLLEKSLLLDNPCDQLVCQCFAAETIVNDGSWVRFLAYARRVHSLCLMDISMKIRPMSFIMLARCAADQRIFPFLSELFISSITSAAPMLLFFAAGALRPSDGMIERTTATREWPAIASPSATQLLTADVDPLAQQASPLRALTVAGPLHSPLLESIASFNRLEELCVESTHVSPSDLGVLAGMEVLKGLRITLRDAQGDVVPYTFGALQYLDVGGHPSDLAWFFGALSAPRLHMVKVDVQGLAFASDVWLPCRAFIEALSSQLRSSLRVVNIKHYYILNKPRARVMDALLPLLQVSGLESLEMDVRLPLSLTGDDIQEMASAWTSLKSLTLTYRDELDMDAPSVFSLAAFAVHCPHLHTLAIPRVVAEPTILRSDILAGPSSRTVTSLSFKYDPKGGIMVEARNVYLMALFVGHTFPNRIPIPLPVGFPPVGPLQDVWERDIPPVFGTVLPRLAPPPTAQPVERNQVALPLYPYNFVVIPPTGGAPTTSLPSLRRRVSALLSNKADLKYVCLVFLGALFMTWDRRSDISPASAVPRRESAWLRLAVVCVSSVVLLVCICLGF
ncbi:hypothetical protein BKA93DRAFT_813259 [Sparassis latifolia]